MTYIRSPGLRTSCGCPTSNWSTTKCHSTRASPRISRPSQTTPAVVITSSPVRSRTRATSTWLSFLSTLKNVQLFLLVAHTSTTPLCSTSTHPLRTTKPSLQMIPSRWLSRVDYSGWTHSLIPVISYFHFLILLSK